MILISNIFLKEYVLELFKSEISRDILREYTDIGDYLDDFEFFLNDKSLKNF